MAIKYVNAKKDLANTDLTTLYTAPSSPATTSIVKSFIISEDAGSTPTITITIVDAADTPATFNLFKTKALTANGTTELLSALLPVDLPEASIVMPFPGEFLFGHFCLAVFFVADVEH